MAAIVLSRRAILVPKLLEKLLFSSPARTAAVAPASAVARRSFNTSSEMREYEDEGSLDNGGPYDDLPVVNRRRGFDLPSFFSDPFDPFLGPSRTLSQVFNMLDMPLTALGGVAPRRGWEAREDKDALYLRLDMPGLGKEDVRVSVEQNTLIVKGEGEESEEELGKRRYSTRIDLHPELYKLEQIRAEMNNGVLKVVVPRVKEEERKDVLQITVE